MLDEDNLAEKLNNLAALASRLEQNLERTRSTQKNLLVIMQVDGANPKDERTGLPMTDSSRQEIYDACIPEAERLLALEF